MRDLLTDLLDALAILLLAAGAGVAVMQWRLGVAFAVAGVVVLVGSLVAAHRGPAEVAR